MLELIAPDGVFACVDETEAAQARSRLRDFAVQARLQSAEIAQLRRERTAAVAESVKANKQVLSLQIALTDAETAEHKALLLAKALEKENTRLKRLKDAKVNKVLEEELALTKQRLATATSAAELLQKALDAVRAERQRLDAECNKLHGEVYELRRQPPVAMPHRLVVQLRSVQEALAKVSLPNRLDQLVGRDREMADGVLAAVANEPEAPIEADDTPRYLEID